MGKLVEFVELVEARGRGEWRDGGLFAWLVVHVVVRGPASRELACDGFLYSRL